MSCHRDPFERTAACVLLLASCLALGAADAGAESSAPDPALLRALARYETLGRELVEACDAEDARSAGLARRAHDLIELAQGLLGPFAVDYPPCGPYLRAAMGVLERLDGIDAEAMERLYHADDALPEAPGFCYHAKDLLVHPATVVVLAREGDERAVHAQMAAEMREALAHVAVVRHLLGLAVEAP